MNRTERRLKANKNCDECNGTGSVDTANPDGSTSQGLLCLACFPPTENKIKFYNAETKSWRFRQ